MLKGGFIFSPSHVYLEGMRPPFYERLRSAPPRGVSHHFFHPGEVLPDNRDQIAIRGDEHRGFQRELAGERNLGDTGSSMVTPPSPPDRFRFLSASAPMRPMLIFSRMVSMISS